MLIDFTLNLLYFTHDIFAKKRVRQGFFLAVHAFCILIFSLCQRQAFSNHTAVYLAV